MTDLVNNYIVTDDYTYILSPLLLMYSIINARYSYFSLFCVLVCYYSTYFQ